MYGWLCARRKHVLLLSGAIAFACGGKPARKTEQPASQMPTAELAKSLTVPPGAGTRHALAALADRGERDPEAAWARAHYLLDVFDDARFGGGPETFDLLADVLAIPARRGPAATDRAIDQLLVEVDRVLRQERLHPGATAARQLLQFDRRPPPASAFAGAVEIVRRIGSGSSDVAANAQLRLAGLCEQAFRDAAAGPPRERWLRVSYCLPALHGHDRAPYLGPERAPIPPWTRLATDLLDSYATIEKGSSRLSRVAGSRQSILGTWLERNAKSLPTVPLLGPEPGAEIGAPYGWTPVFDSPADAKQRRLDLLVRGDGRATATWRSNAQSRGRDLWAAAEAARAAGAARIHLLVADVVVANSVPPYWQTQPGLTATLRRAAVLPLLLPEASSAATAAVPRGQRWSSSGHLHQLTVRVAPGRWTVHTDRGLVATVDASKPANREQLGAAIDRFLDAFPDAQGVAIDPSDEVGIAEVVDVTQRLSRRPSDDAPRFSQVALARSPKATGRGITQSITRRSSARVTIDPISLNDRIPVIRRCYQDVLEKRPGSRATVVAEVRGEAVFVVSGPKKGPLWTCAVPPISDQMVKDGIRNVTVKLSPR